MSSNQSNPQTRSELRSERGRGPKGHHTLWTIIKWLIVLFLAFILLGAVVFFYYAQGAPNISQSALESDTSTKVYDSNNDVISRAGAQNRDYVKSKNIPAQLKSAVVSIEDRRFYKNHGVDPLRIVSAAVHNVTGSSLGLQGGSTLTQQLVKLSVFSTAKSDQTLKRKAQEAWLAVKVDQTYSKQQILEFYINKVYMGNGVYGMETAAKYYYGKSLSKLNLQEMAMVAGMPQSPTNYDPIHHPQYAKYRRNQVLDAMVSNKQITAGQAAAAKATSVQSGLAKTHPVSTINLTNQKYIDSYLKQVYAELKSDGYNTNTDGLRVYTNLNMSAQKHLYSIANSNNYVAYPSSKFQLGATMVNPKNGKVVAMLGGRKTGNVTFGLNRAVQTDRSSGSTAKPIADYGPAIQYLKYPTYQPVQDTQYYYPGSTRELNDFDNRHEGTITMRKALVESRNIPAVRTLDAVGINRATNFLGKLGMTFNDKLTLQNGIGLYISTEQEAAAYAAFANGGTYYKPHMLNRVVTADGKSHSYGVKGTRAMSPATAFMITDMLKGVMTSSNGSGTAANISGLYQAGKTGTTAYPDNYASQVPADAAMDSWFTGYTKNYSLSVWTGYDKQFQTGHYIPEAQTRIAQEIYRSEMSYVQQNASNTDWTAPSDVVATRRNGTTEYYVAGYPGDASTATNDGTSSNTNTNDTTGNNQANTNTSSRTSSSSESSSTSTEQRPTGGNGGSGNGNDTKDTNSASTESTPNTNADSGKTNSNASKNANS
ncbi:penicillin-binding protein [Lactobacillus sp. LC28-10]|uniref:Penicillin-binding protein n=1 Tax=Secundilactobacillus angelensis TaxID=2722706 RepID=A0ABX1KUZ5_9LACO|nr:transglycosylase domain-containing protein [Secundilactobacillus angelensis]MCH5461440.1 penicillin-binding protein [Secundilactobacillus angelensis]NLR17747.1 penicillin-binding protein [Secundilactobacillus angelensis]